MHSNVSKATAKNAAISGLIFSGLSALLLIAMVVGIQRQPVHSPGQRDWGLVFGVAFGVPFMFFLLAAAGSFLVSAVRAVRQRVHESPQPLTSDITPSPESFRVRHPGIITFVGIVILLVSARVSPVALFFVGIPALLVACGLAGGARLPSKVPFRDVFLYVCVSVAIVVGILVYALYHH